jgi:hypothetical protein
MIHAEQDRNCFRIGAGASLRRKSWVPDPWVLDPWVTDPKVFDVPVGAGGSH